MTNKKNLLLLVSLLVVSVVFCMTAVIFSVIAQQSNQFTIEYDFETEYTKGDTISIPGGRFGSKEAECRVTLPNGTTYFQPEMLELSLQGSYVVSYMASIDGNDYEEKKTFTVKTPLYSFTGSGSGSDASYGYDETTNRTGIVLNLAENQVFTYGQLVDISSADVDNPAIRLTWSSKAESATGAGVLYLRFTDVLDPENYVEIYIGGIDSTGYNYTRARANGQPYSGYDNKSKRYHTGNQYGAAICVANVDSAPYSLWAPARYGTATDLLKKQYVEFVIDPQTKQVNGRFNHFLQAGDAANYKYHLTDLDDISFQPFAWKGFSTDKAILSVWATNYTSDSATIIIDKIGGVENLNMTDVDESAGPQITLDTQGYDVNDLPNGAKDGSFPVFTATAYDAYCGYVSSKAKVYYQYSKAAGYYPNMTTDGSYVIEMPVKNGRVQTPYIGLYAISYTAKDYFGNTSEYVVPFTVTDGKEREPMFLTEGYAVTGTVGNCINLASVLSYGSGVGRSVLTVTVSFENKPIEVKGSELTGFYFVPEKAGYYVVDYVHSDFVENKLTASYVVNVSLGDGKGFSEKVSLPKVLVEGYGYRLPDIYTTDYTQNKFKELASVKITDGAGERVYASGSLATFTADSNNQAVITYGSGENLLTYTIPVVKIQKEDSKDLDLSKYFITSEGVQKELQKSGMFFMATEESTVDYLLDQSDSNLQFKLLLQNLGTDYNKFSVILTDSLYPSIAAKVSVYGENGKYSIAVNDVCEYPDVTDITSSLSAEIGYEKERQLFLFNGTIGVTIDKTLYGTEFNGFTSGKVTIRFVVEDVNTTAGFAVTKINNQDILQAVTVDRVAPVLTINGRVPSIVKQLGDIGQVFSATGSDVLSGYVDISVSVSFKAVGSTVTEQVFSTSGLELTNLLADKEYEFLFDKFGTYTISYIAVDWNGMRSTSGLKYEVIDMQAPTVDADVISGVKCGQTVEVKNIVVSDNVTSTDNINVTINVLDPANKVTTGNNNSFIVKYIGKYTVYVTARDEAGNFAVKKLILYVGE